MDFPVLAKTLKRVYLEHSGEESIPRGSLVLLLSKHLVRDSDVTYEVSMVLETGVQTTAYGFPKDSSSWFEVVPLDARR
jgi:hypothetical protein